MNRRIGFSLLGGFLCALALWAGPSQAKALTPEEARSLFVESLASEYGSNYTEAGRKWADCPTVYPIGYYEYAAPCMAEFRRGKTWMFASASVDSNLTVTFYSDSRWQRKMRRCRPGYLKRISLHGVLWVNDRRCSTATLMASDLAGYVRIGKPRLLRRVGWHGTNMIGFGRIADYRCKTKRRGNLYRVRCRNSLGDAFKLRMRVSRTVD